MLFRGERVEMARPVEAGEKKQPGSSSPKTSPVERTAPEEGLLAALKALRARLARQEDVPAYIVFSNATLADMASKKPQNMAELLQISGVGYIKAARYGETFLREIAAYYKEGRSK